MRRLIILAAVRYSRAFGVLRETSDTVVEWPRSLRSAFSVFGDRSGNFAFGYLRESSARLVRFVRFELQWLRRERRKESYIFGRFG